MGRPDDPALICQLDGCGREKRHDQLFCKHHWFMVPKSIQNRVWNSWRRVQRHEGSGAISDYRTAVQEATTAVQERDAKRGNQRDLF